MKYSEQIVKNYRGKTVDNSTYKGLNNVYLELAKMELAMRGICDDPIYWPSIDWVLKWLDDRNDCGDFAIPCLVRMLHEHKNRLGAGYEERIEKSLLGFKYWLDEPGEVHACFFTENHQILFHSDEYLVGQLYPDKIFDNGKDGEWHRQHAIAFIRRWQDWRIRFGFSEWLTQGYYAEDVLGLLGLAFYAEEEDIRTNSVLIINQLLFDLAVNSFYGHLPTTHGRVYAPSLIDPDTEGVSPIMYVMWGEGTSHVLSNIAILLEAYDYQCPEAIAKVGKDRPALMINKERMSIDVNEGKYYGADPADFDNIMLYWGIQAYSDRLTIDNSAKVFPYYNWMNNRIFAYKERYELCDEAGVPAPEGTPDYTAMTKVNIYTYKTPDYILSCAQDFRPGRMGYQQHPWTACLGEKAIVFTNSPASENFTSRPNKLAGNLVLPRAAAHNNVVLAAYRVLPDFVDYLYTQCYFPQGEFDEVVEKGKWLFGRKKDAYVAVSSLNAARWEQPSPEYKPYCQDKEMLPYIYMAPGHANVWAIELGSKVQNGSFEEFCARFENAAIQGDTHHFTYHSPSQGEMKFGWTCPLVVNGEKIPLGDYPRYDNPYCQAEFNTRVLDIRAGGSRVVLDAAKGLMPQE